VVLVARYIHQQKTAEPLFPMVKEKLLGLALDQVQLVKKLRVGGAVSLAVAEV